MYLERISEFQSRSLGNCELVQHKHCMLIITSRNETEKIEAGEEK
jgi:hypothetical protein